jgi:hypothetical protein
VKNSSIPAIAVLALLALGMPLVATPLFAQTPAPQSFVAYLSAAPGVSTNATGEATFQVSPDGSSITYELNVSNIDNVFMAHIHLSPSMDILIWLDPNPNTVSSSGESACLAVLSTPPGPIASCPGFKSGSFTGVLAKGTITAADLNGTATCPGCSGLSAPTMSDLITDLALGQTFVNVHTQQKPGGEIQGNIVPEMTGATTVTASGSVTTTTVTMTASTTSGVSNSTFYAVVGLLVIFVIATAFFALRKKPAS